MKKIFVDEWWELSDTEVERNRFNRIIRRSRKMTFPPGLEDGESVRAWILDRIAHQASHDITDREREETAAWAARVTNASNSVLWDEYLNERLQQPR